MCNDNQSPTSTLLSRITSPNSSQRLSALQEYPFFNSFSDDNGIIQARISESCSLGRGCRAIYANNRFEEQGVALN
jgi:hypothetical protein